jgi:endogenous inhibitor of DNA gyrase (YacG/DUF329 family)
MKKEKCKSCGEEIELQDDDRIKVCCGQGQKHITLKEWEEKQRRKREKNESQ